MRFGLIGLSMYVCMYVCLSLYESKKIEKTPLYGEKCIHVLIGRPMSIVCMFEDIHTYILASKYRIHHIA